VYNYLPWFLTTLKQAGNPEDDTDLEINIENSRLQVPRGAEAALIVRVHNRGSSEVDQPRFSLQTRLDLRAKPVSTGGHSIAPGGTRELRYEIEAPEQINLTSESHRMSYAHFSGVHRRGKQTYVTHVPLQIEITR
jgi:hypothetical protein